jgi:hypothetical protein
VVGGAEDGAEAGSLAQRFDERREGVTGLAVEVDAIAVPDVADGELDEGGLGGVGVRCGCPA